MDYSLLRRQEFAPHEVAALPNWDVFISAFNKSERVNTVFAAVGAARKDWVVHPEYDFRNNEVPGPTGNVFRGGRDEADFWLDYFEWADLRSWPLTSSVCIDITGFMRPHLMLLPRLLHHHGFSRLHVIYSDPLAYQSGDRTVFTQGAVTRVGQVRGFEGLHVPDSGEDDLLVLGAGYDSELIRRVAEDKRGTRKLQMFGLPSLQPHMYEENRLRAAAAEEAMGPLAGDSLLFAPANNPFATAQELHDRLALETRRPVSNLYLSPLATKPQALGFALYYMCERVGTATSIIFPYAEHYSHETSVGLARISLYELELDWFLTESSM